MNLLNLKDASKSFGDRVILSGVTAGVDAGDKIGLIGENGAGKSTLLRILANLEALDDGELVIWGQLHIAYVAQEPQLRQDARARDILAEPLADVVALVARYEQLSALMDPKADAVLEEIEAQGGWEWEHHLERAAQTSVALDRLRESAPDVILLDLMMPVMDGIDFLAAVGGDERWSEIPVIVLTAKDLDDADRQALNGKVAQVVAKGSYSGRDVASRVRALLG